MSPRIRNPHAGTERYPLSDPLIALSGFVFVFGFVYDFAMEAICVRLGLYSFTQVIPFGSVFVGTRWQFPLLWQSSLISILMIPAAVLIYRDDTGQAVAETAITRWTGAATSVICPWPWPSAKPYDPQGFYERCPAY